MKKTHRSIEFDVHRLGDNRWEWVAYPKLGEGERFAGTVEADEEKAMAAARAAIDAWLGSVSEPRESGRPFQPDPSQWDTSTWDDAASRIATTHSQRNDASLNSGGSQVFPPPPQATIIQVPPTNSAATVDTPPGAVAGTAPQEIGLEARASAALKGGGGMIVNTEVGPAGVIAQVGAVSFRGNVERAEKLARALATTIRKELERLKDERRNEPEWREQIDFLELAAATLDQIAAAIAEARQATTPEERERRFSEAEGWATSLAKAAKNFAERNYERVVDYAGYSTMVILGTVLFTGLFDVSADKVLAIQMLLLGFSGGKKD